ncbi:MAG: hypothetical protein P1P88_04120 [Bacteroidales bacterium]|nr:hypothetical protein [Bacteroidales bacterium]
MINNRSFLRYLVLFLFIWSVDFASALCYSNGYAPKNSFDLRKFSFTAKDSKMLPGLSTEKNSGYNCSGIIKDEDKIGKMAIVALFYQNGCYTDGQYNHRNYKVEWGKVSDSENEYSFDAYRINEPVNKATKFLASSHCLAYQFDKKQDYNLYELEGEKINKVLEIDANDITPGEYFLITEVKISSFSGGKIYFVVPANITLSIYNQYSNTVEGGMVKQTPLANVYKYRYQTNNIPYDNELSNNANTRQYFLLDDRENHVGLIWQDKENQTINYSLFGSDLKSENSVKLPNSNNAQLVAATIDDASNLYYLTVKEKGKSDGTDLVTIHKTNSSGSLIKKSLPETSKSGLNIFHFGNYMADMQYINGKIGLFIARTMFASSDGLNHQGGIAVLFDANTLEVLRNFGQTSGHSFDNYLTKNADNEFIGIDLGDNYPRGINLHKFSDSQIHSRVIYTFKTEHGSSAKSPAGATYPFYSEISSSGKKYYKWSNDNATYSTLGAIIEEDDGYVVVFTGEPDPNGKSINNSRAGNASTDPRNIGFIKVLKDFETKSGGGNVVTDDIILSKGISESGGFYTFGGRWSEQRNTGVQWLTSYRDKSIASAANLKAAKLSDGNILLIWEKYAIDGYNYKYLSTYTMKIDKDGKDLSGAIDIGNHVRLNRRDEPLVIGNKVILASGSKAEKKLELLVLEMK